MHSVTTSLTKNLFLHPNGSRSRSLFPISESNHRFFFFNPLRARRISLIPQIAPPRADRNGFEPISSSSWTGKEHQRIAVWSGRDRLSMANLNRVMTAVFLAVSFCSSSSSARASSPEEAFVRKTVSSHDVVIFSKSYCPYCRTAKAVFEELKKKPYVVELDERDDGGDIQDALSEIVGRRTVPQVFIKGKHVGGSDDTVGAYQSGSLAKLLGKTSDDL